MGAAKFSKSFTSFSLSEDIERTVANLGLIFRCFFELSFVFLFYYHYSIMFLAFIINYEENYSLENP